jgi:hypothetical protein
MMTEELTLTLTNNELGAAETRPRRLPSLPWRDPHTVSREELSRHIEALERAVLKHPKCAGTRTCLGMAYAMNYDVYKSMDALDAATKLEPDHFWAQVKRTELDYRLRALVSAEKGTLKALDLASNPWEYSVARHQLQEIRRLMREGTQKPEWNKSLKRPAFYFSAMTVILCLAVYFK